MTQPYAKDLNPTTGRPYDQLNPAMTLPLDQRAPLTGDFAVSDHVQRAALDWPLLLRTGEEYGTGLLMCRVCRQGIITLWKGNASYIYTAEERNGLLIAHLIQRHGWTRETLGSEEQQ